MRVPVLEAADRRSPYPRLSSARRRGEEAGALTTQLALERYKRDQDPQALAWLVGEYRYLATRLAHRFYRHREPLDDLQQVAYEGLLQAMQRFDPESGRPFEVFAVSTIAGTLKRHYRDRGWSIRVPRAVHDTYPRMRCVADELTQRYGRSPTIAELAASLEMSEENVIELLAAGSSRDVGSLDVAEGLDHPLWAGSDAALVRIDDRESLRRVLAGLPAGDRELIKLYFFDNLSQAEIGQTLGRSQIQISRLLRRVLDRLRARLAADADCGWAVDHHVARTEPQSSSGHADGWLRRET